MRLPDRLAVDADGFVWRVWYDEEHWSMAPSNPDNKPVPGPMTYYMPVKTDRTIAAHVYPTVLYSFAEATTAQLQKVQDAVLDVCRREGIGIVSGTTSVPDVGSVTERGTTE